MNYENYFELYEAIYLLEYLNNFKEIKVEELCCKIKAKEKGISLPVYDAMMRILVTNDFVEFIDECYIINEEQNRKLEEILKIITHQHNRVQYEEFLVRAKRQNHFFFNDLSELEYDIYSRYNFKITSQIGKNVCKQMDFDNTKILELGGNSGGLGTEIMMKYQDCTYTIVDQPIPCQIGNEFKALNQVRIDFVTSDVFDLKLKKGDFDHVILMNLLHDFNDDQCDQVIRNSLNSCEKHPKFIIIEDILENECTPKDAIMHGLRLSVACFGGKQRTIEDFKNLFGNHNYKLEHTVSLDKVHRMMIMQPVV